MSELVCAVVVTFNRKTLLRTCLSTLLAQTRPPDHILVVDNASTDGTLQLLQQEFPTLQVLALTRNSGGAGGFHDGMRWAYDAGYDWIWVMDDDIELVPNALEMLLGFGGVGDLISPRKRLSDGVMTWEAMWNTSACYPEPLTRDLSFANGLTWTPVTYANFEGALMRRVVMERSGFPDKRYFVGGDDSMYGLRAHFHVRVIYADCIAIVKHLIALAPRGRMGFYLQIRNRFLHYEHFKSLGLPVDRPLFLIQTVKAAIRDFAQVLTNPPLRNKANFLAVWDGFFDGLAGRFGPPPWIR